MEESYVEENNVKRKDHPFWELLQFAIIALLIVVPIQLDVSDFRGRQLPDCGRDFLPF